MISKSNLLSKAMAKTKTTLDLIKIAETEEALNDLLLILRSARGVADQFKSKRLYVLSERGIVLAHQKIAELRSSKDSKGT